MGEKTRSNGRDWRTSSKARDRHSSKLKSQGLPRSSHVDKSKEKPEGNPNFRPRLKAFYPGRPASKGFF